MKFDDRVKINRKDDFLDGEEAVVIDGWDGGGGLVYTVVFISYSGYHYQRQYAAEHLEKIDENI